MKKAMCLSFAIAIFIFITLVICKSVTVGNEDEKNKMDKMVEKIKEHFKECESKEMLMTGIIVDEKGNPLNDVKLVVEKRKSDISEIFMTEREYIDKKVESKNTEIETRETNSNFSFECKGWHSISLTFQKKGYYPVRETLTTMPSREGQGDDVLGQRIKENIKIVLREIGTLAKLKRNGICLDWEKDEDGKITKTGWVYTRKTNKNDEGGEKRNNITYDDPTEVDFYVDKTEDGNGLYLIANGDAGFIQVENVTNLTYLSEAPEDGYKNRITVPFKKNNQYCYFKLKEGLYGKLRISTVFENEDKTTYSLTGTYYLNTTGSRNLRSMERY